MKQLAPGLQKSRSVRLRCSIAISERRDDVLADSSPQVGLKKFYLRWVLHVLSVNQQSERVSYSNFHLIALMEHKPSDFERVVTGDES
jgi:hypothetical protein